MKNEAYEYPDETLDPMTRGQDDMRGRIATVGIGRAAFEVAQTYAPPFDIDSHARLQGIILAAFEAGQLDGITNKERVY